MPMDSSKVDYAASVIYGISARIQAEHNLHFLWNNNYRNLKDTFQGFMCLYVLYSKYMDVVSQQTNTVNANPLETTPPLCRENFV